MENTLLPDEQLDTLKNGLKIIQNPKKFMFGIDAVLLSYFAASQIRNESLTIDLGTGTGIIPLLLKTSTKAKKIYGLEIQPESADMARRSVELNNLQEKIQIVNGDIKNVPALFEKHSFNSVTSNPPYMIDQHGKQNPNDAKRIARHEVLCNLEDVIKAADYLLKPNGSFFLIHRPFRLAEIFSLMYKYNLEPKRMQLIYPYLNKEPNIVLIEAKKNANPRLQVLEPLFVYDTPGVYTAEINQIYDSFTKPIQAD